MRTHDADSLLVTESKFAEAELLYHLTDQRDRAALLYREFLEEASEDNPNVKLATGRLRELEATAVAERR